MPDATTIAAGPIQPPSCKPLMSAVLCFVSKLCAAPSCYPTLQTWARCARAGVYTRHAHAVFQLGCRRRCGNPHVAGRVSPEAGLPRNRGRGLKGSLRSVVDASRPVVIVLDLMISGECGLSLCRGLRVHSGVSIIMLAARGDETDRIVELEMGIDDDLARQFYPRKLLARIRGVLQSGNPWRVARSSQSSGRRTRGCSHVAPGATGSTSACPHSLRPRTNSSPVASEIVARVNLDPAGILLLAEVGRDAAMQQVHPGAQL